jgi:DNA-binding NarL/FixJ family response regulator
MSAIRILIVDDHTLFREGLRAIFRAVPDIEVVGEAGSGEEAIAKTLGLQPDIILMDIQMAGMNGIEACKQILEKQPDTAIVMLTMLEDSDSLFAAMIAGAKGYVLKGADKAEVLRTIRAVADGEVLFGAAIASRMTDFFRSVGSTPRIARQQPFPELTEREREILDLIAQGVSNSDIAARLNVTAKTVSNHISNIFNKLQVTDRAQAMLKARDAGMGKGE